MLLILKQGESVFKLLDLQHDKWGPEVSNIFNLTL